LTILHFSSLYGKTRLPHFKIFETSIKYPQLLEKIKKWHRTSGFPIIEGFCGWKKNTIIGINILLGKIISRVQVTPIQDFCQKSTFCPNFFFKKVNILEIVI
jgi:hypothetical protein